MAPVLTYKDAGGFIGASDTPHSRNPGIRRCGFSETRWLHSQKKRAGHPYGDGECRPCLFPAARLASYKTENKAHSPNTAPQTGTAVPIESLTAAGKIAQAILALCAGPMSFISARSKKRATIVWSNLPAAVRLLIGTVVPVCGAVLGLWALLSVL